MPKPFLLLYCFIIIFPIAYTTDYCKICKNKSHTMCKYKEGPSKSCKSYSSTKISSQLKTEIENLHNELRNKVALGKETRGALGPQPSATNMFVMKWDNELAKIAQRWADQCISTTEVNQHDSCKDTTRFKVGQNVMQVIRGSKPMKFERIVIQIIKNWYNEVDRLTPAQIKSFKGASEPTKEVGHYSQIMWANTKYVGCGHASFTENISRAGTTVESRIETFVCNYGPTGNIIDASIYKVGKPCSTCNCTKTYPALCKNKNKSNLKNTETKTKREAKNDEKTVTTQISPLKNSTTATLQEKSTTAMSQKTTTGTSPTEHKSSVPTSTEVLQLTSEVEACTPRDQESHHYHHHAKGEKCPFETLRTRFRLLHQDGDDCYCLFRVKDSAKQLLPDMYLFYIILYYFKYILLP